MSIWKHIISPAVKLCEDALFLSRIDVHTCSESSIYSTLLWLNHRPLVGRQHIVSRRRPIKTLICTDGWFVFVIFDHLGGVSLTLPRRHTSFICTVNHNVVQLWWTSNEK